jgi:hypothetical protein
MPAAPILAVSALSLPRRKNGFLVSSANAPISVSGPPQALLNFQNAAPMFSAKYKPRFSSGIFTNKFGGV